MQIEERELKNRLVNNRKLQNRKQIRKLLLTKTVADLEQFTAKNKQITYTEVFVELYNQKNYKQVHEMQEKI